MSDSRLEKFIYAICSMDVSDLPVPLSRIEKLWNCLITGETPDFEPLSRNEKYLMAMLDRYDISNLPAPMSRGEKLLYKIAVGETDLSDVPGYLSRYEELLKYLIENGGISGGDFEYVLYTLNQSLYTLYTTAEKPVKSAILKGNTLVNLAKVRTATTYNICSEKNIAIKPNTKYIALFNPTFYEPSGNYALLLVSSVSLDDSVTGGDDAYSNSINGGLGTEYRVAKGNRYLIFTSKENETYLHIRTGNNNGILYTDMIILEYQDGMENWDIPYFEGMKSVQMPVLTTTGKNLFDGHLEKGWSSTDGSLIDMDRTRTNLIFVEKNETYTVSRNKKTTLKIDEFDGNSNFIKTTTYQTANVTLTTSAQTKYIRVLIAEPLDEVANHGLQLEKGTQATSYEPYKSNILSTSEDVELRGIGDVKDTLDLTTGELTERIGEIVLDGSEDWAPFDMYDVDGYSTFVAIIPTLNNYYDGGTSFISADFATGSWSSYLGNKESEIVYNHDPNKIGIRVKSEKASNVAGIKAFLSTNNIRINYKLATESIKTVDLSIQDQDNQPTQLGTFENVTHVSLEAENLIPEVEMEVATHISEELASVSPLMDDISTKQEQLNTMVDEQSENVDATMIATTEIYEETL